MTPLIFSATLLLGLCGQTPADAPPADPLPVEASWKPLGRGLWFDAASKPRRLMIQSRVVFREGPLEHLLCLRGTKEHEAVLSTEAAPLEIHAGLLLTGAEPGGPVEYKPKFRPPRGPAVAITARWKQGDAVREADARTFIRDEKTKKTLGIDWVFAGSLRYEDPVTKKSIYAAQDGDLITVANFASSILDLPIDSSADDASRNFFADTERIPPLGTEVQLILSPRPKAPQASPATP